MTPAFEALTHRRWRILALFCLINFCTGALYVWSVFAGPLAAHLATQSGMSISAATLGPVFGLATGITPFLMLAGGFINDRMGPRLMIALGGVAIGVGYLLTAYATHPSFLYFSYGILAGAGTGLVNGCTITSAVKFFPDRRGFAGGTVTACLGIGAAVQPFIATALLSSFGITTTLLLFGVVLGVVITFAGLLTEQCPAGFAEALRPSSHSTHVMPKSFSPLEMLRTAEFLPLFVLFTCSATMGLMLLSNISAIAQEQLGASAAWAALAVSVISIANTCGRFLSGTLSDRMGRIPTLMAALMLALVGLWLLSSAGVGNTTQFFLGITGIGICFGAFIGIYPGLVADEYGPAHSSVNFSLMMFGYSVGGLVGPLLVRWAAESAAGDFSRAYLASSAIAALGLLCALIVLLLKRHATHPSKVTKRI